MNRIVSKLRLALLVSAVSCAVACGSDDTVDNPPGTDGGGGARVDSGNSKEGSSDVAVNDASKSDAVESGPDVGTEGGADTAAPDTSAPDAGGTDATVPDTGSADRVDSGAPDAGRPDATPDTGTVDTGTTDGRPLDTGLPETGTPDASTPDVGAADGNAADAADASTADAVDASTADAVDASTADAADSGAREAGDGGSPCAAFNAGAGCTPTEQRFVDRSPDCYACMANAGCLDDDLFSDTGHECGDVTGNSIAGGKIGTPRQQLCLEMLDCALQTSCGSIDVAICYCGSLGAGNACATAAAGVPNGMCLQKELDGLEHLVSEAPSVVLPDFTGLALGSGMANQLFNCAKSNDCIPLCFP